MPSLVDAALRLTYANLRWRRLSPPRPVLGVRSYALGGDSRLVVKIATPDDLIDTCLGPGAEARRLAWLAAAGVACPEVVDSGELDGGQYAVLRVPRGRPASAEWPRHQQLAVCDAVADTVRALHGIGAAACPFDRSLKVTIPRAKEAVVFAEVDARDPMTALADLIARVTSVGRQDPVVCHGDLRPGNVLVDPETSRVTAVMDVARLGVADRYTDLAQVTRGWARPDMAQRFWYRYGEIPADSERLGLYRSLARFC